MTANNHNNDGVEERFFAEGAGSYRAAMVALGEFRNIVDKKCRKVLQNCLGNFAQAIGLNLTLEQVKDWRNPGNPSSGWDGSWANLGVRIELSNYGGAYFGLRWDMREQEPRVIAMIHFLNPELFRSASCLIDTSPMDVQGLDIMLYEPIRADQFRDFEGILTRMIDEWSRVWRDIGGLSALHSA